MTQKPGDLADPARLEALARSRLMDSEPQERYDRLTRLVRRALDTPVALICLVDDTRQFFVSESRMHELPEATRQTPLSHSFCQHVVTSAQPFSVSDARGDALVCNNLAVSELGVVAYLGVPVRGPSGHVLGSLCAIDAKPRQWTPDDERTLRDIATIVEEQIGMEEIERRWRLILNTMPQMVWSTLPDGYHDFYNDRWYEFTGVPYGSTDGEGWRDMFHEDDRARAWARWSESLSTGKLYEIEYRLRHHSGQYRWTLGRALPIRNLNGEIERWFGTCTDIHELKEAEAARDLIGRELAHRIQNIFAVVNGLIITSSRQSPQAREFADTVSARIRALAVAHRYVGADGARPIDGPESHDKTVHGVIGTIMAPYGGRPEHPAVVISGNDATIDMTAATTLALVLHEFATNAVKYGALSVEGGRIIVACTQGADLYQIEWREQSGPAIAEAPPRTGFGSTLVNSMMAPLGGRVERAWNREGLTATIRIPFSALTASHERPREA